MRSYPLNGYKNRHLIPEYRLGLALGSLRQDKRVIYLNFDGQESDNGRRSRGLY